MLTPQKALQGKASEEQLGRWCTYHETKIPPLVEKVAIYVDAVGLGEVFGDELADGGQVGGFFAAVVLDVAEVVMREVGGGHCGVLRE